MPACGYDLRDNEAVAQDPGHTYSSILFADKAKEVVLNHNSSQVKCRKISRDLYWVISMDSLQGYGIFLDR